MWLSYRKWERVKKRIIEILGTPSEFSSYFSLIPDFVAPIMKVPYKVL